MMQEVLQSVDFEALKERSLMDCLIPEKTGSLGLKKLTKWDCLLPAASFGCKKVILQQCISGMAPVFSPDL